jgi:hypothetical protein
MTQPLFSPAQANAALALVRPIVADVVLHHTRIVDLVNAYQAKKREPNASQVFLNETKQEMAAVTAQRDACVAELAAVGVELKDAATGLVDFPGELDGERVLWCWRLGEERVEFFHGEAEGFEGRKPIPVPVHAG